MAIHVRHRAVQNITYRLICCLLAVFLCSCMVLSLAYLPIQKSLSKSEMAEQIVAILSPQKTQQTPADKPQLTDFIPPSPEPLMLIDSPPLLTPCTAPEYTIDATELSEDLAYILFPSVEELETTTKPAQNKESGKQHNPPTNIDSYTPPQYAATPQPDYPKELLRKRIKGSVKVRIHIDTKGIPTAVDILSSTHPAFSQAVKRKILSTWQFLPARADKHPVSSTVVTTVNFESKGR